MNCQRNWLGLLAVGMVLAAPSAARADYEAVVKPFLAAHCVGCHGEKEPKGELQLDTLAADFAAPANATHWGDVMDRLSAGTMPPKGKPRPDAKAAAQVVEWIAGKFAETEAARLARREQVSFHRLTREEYAHTIRDLLGVTFVPGDPVGLPEDDEWKGFERIGSVQSLSPSHVEKYYAAAEMILAEAFPTKPPAAYEFRQTALKMRNRPQDWERVEKEGRADQVRVDLWPGHAVQHGRVGLREPVASGDYVFRLRLSGLKPDGGLAPHLVVYAKEIDRILHECDVVAPEDQPITIEFRAHLPAGVHTLSIGNQVPGPSNLPRSGREDFKRFFFSTKEGRAPWQTKLTDEAGKPMWPFLILDWFEIQGPVGAGGPTFAQREYLPDPSSGTDALRLAVAKFVTRAYRRPARPSDVEPLLSFIRVETASGTKPEAALKSALLAVLCSKDFLFLVEGAPGRTAAALDDWEFAARLSYFLRGTSPDDRLTAAAASGELRGPAGVRDQTRRMLHADAAGRLADSFAWQWLQLRNVGKFPPDKLLYPDYDKYLEKCMTAESQAFVREVLANNLSVREFLDSDWAMLNARLARHYGIPGVEGDEFRRVPLRPDDHRGGLLAQAAVLSLTSDGQRHRPVHRGKWVMETVYGKSPPPPPPNVDPIEPTPPTGAKTSLRAKLAAHKANANCAACHVKIDPLGFAFDNYDAIGRWRTVEVVGDGKGENPPVDASGELADGRKFTGPDEFKKLLLADADVFAAAVVEKLASFALRRAMTVDDRPYLAKVVAEAKAADYRLADTVEALTASELFLRR